MRKLADCIEDKMLWNRVAILILPCILTLTTISTHHENIYVSRKSLKVYLNTESPAYAALEDTRNEWTTNYLYENENQFLDNPLKWGENKYLWALENSSRLRYTQNLRDLNPLVVRTKFQPQKKPTFVIPPEVESQKMSVAKGDFDFNDFHPERARVARNLIQASEATAFSDSNSLDERLQAIVEKEKAMVYNPKQALVIKNGVAISASPSSSVPPTTKKQSAKERDDVAGRSFRFSGNLTMKGGLAFTGFSDHIRVYRVSENLIMDEGYVHVREGYYEIEVRELYGYIVAELIGKDDMVKGYAEIDLHQLDTQGIKANDIELNHDLQLKPHKEGFHVKAISGLSFHREEVPIPVAKDRYGQALESEQVKVAIHGLEQELALDQNNKITSDMFTQDSNMVIRLEAKNHWGSLAIGFGETNSKIRMYKDSMVKALLGQYEGNHENEGIIWGRVVDENGQPIEGAQVELAGDELAIGPIYFNKAYLPDHSIKATQADGLFAFIKVLPGLQAVRARVNGKLLPVELTVSDSQHISYVQIHQDGHRHVSLVSYNPLTRQRVDTSVKLHGLDKIYNIESGQRNIEEWPGRRGLAILESDPGPSYELTRHMINRQDKHLEVPVISRQWLGKTLQAYRANRDTGKGVVVGFVEGDGFEVYVGQELLGWNSDDIIYFDEYGRILTKKIGRAGGGFIMYNVPEGMSSLSILSRNSEKVSTQLTITDRNYTNVVVAKFNTR